MLSRRRRNGQLGGSTSTDQSPSTPPSATLSSSPNNNNNINNNATPLGSSSMSAATASSTLSRVEQQQEQLLEQKTLELNNECNVFFSFPSFNIQYKFLVIQHSFLKKAKKRVLYLLTDQLLIHEIVHDSIHSILSIAHTHQHQHQQHQPLNVDNSSSSSSSDHYQLMIPYAQIQQIQVSSSNPYQFTIHYKPMISSSKVKKETFTLITNDSNSSTTTTSTTTTSTTTILPPLPNSNNNNNTTTTNQSNGSSSSSIKLCELDSFYSLLYRFQSFDMYQVKPVVHYPFSSTTTTQSQSSSIVYYSPIPPIITYQYNNYKNNSNNSNIDQKLYPNHRYYVTKWKKSNEKSDQVLCILKSCILVLDAMNTQNVLNIIDVMAIDQLIQVSQSPLASSSSSSHSSSLNDLDSLQQQLQQQQQLSALVIVMKHDSLHYAYKQHYYFMTNDAQAIISCIQLVYHQCMSPHGHVHLNSGSGTGSGGSGTSGGRESVRDSIRLLPFQQSSSSQSLSSQSSLFTIPVITMDEQQVIREMRTLNPYHQYMTRNHFSSLLSLTTNNNNNNNNNNGSNNSNNSNSSNNSVNNSNHTPSPPFMIYHSVQRVKLSPTSSSSSTSSSNGSNTPNGSTTSTPTTTTTNQQQQQPQQLLLGTNRLLFMNYDYLIESDMDGKYIYQVHAMKSIHCIVRFDDHMDHYDMMMNNSGNKSNDNNQQQQQQQQQQYRYFSIEFRNGTHHTYRTMSSNRDIILLNLMQMANHVRGHGAAPSSSMSSLPPLPSSSTTTTNHHHHHHASSSMSPSPSPSSAVFITSEMTIHGLREGSHHSYRNRVPHEQVTQQLLMKKLHQLDKFQSVRDKCLLLRELVISYQLVQLPIKDKTVMKHLVRWYHVMTGAPSINIRILSLILNSVSRILPYKIIYDDLLQQVLSSASTSTLGQTTSTTGAPPLPTTTSASYRLFIDKLIQQLVTQQYDSTVKYYSAIILLQLCSICVRSFKLKNDQSTVLQFINQVLFHPAAIQIYSDCIANAAVYGPSSNSSNSNGGVTTTTSATTTVTATPATTSTATGNNNNNNNNHDDMRQYRNILTIDALLNMFRHVFKLNRDFHFGGSVRNSHTIVSSSTLSDDISSDNNNDNSLVIEILMKCTDSLFAMRHVLYRWARSKPISTIHIVLDLLIILCVRAKNQELEVIQNDVLNNGLIICLIYDALFCPLATIRNRSLHLCDLLISFHAGCKELMKRIVPNALLRDLSTSNTTRREVTVTVIKSLFGKTKLKQDSDYVVQTQNWRRVFELLATRDYENADVIWNDGTRLDLKNSLQYQIESLDAANDRIMNSLVSSPSSTSSSTTGSAMVSPCVWNFIEFKVLYPSLKNEPRVGQYYLKYIAAQKGKRISLDEPIQLLRDVYYHLMLEESEPLKLLSAKALTNIYVNELFPDSIPFPHLDHLVHQMTSGQYSRRIIYEILQLLSNAIILWENANMVNDKCIPLLMGFVKEVHTSYQKYNSSTSTVSMDDCDNPGRMATLSLTILYQLSLFRTKKLREGQIIRPLPSTVRLITDPDSMAHIIQLLALGMIQNSSTQVQQGEMLNIRKKLIQQVIPLVQHLLLVNDVVVRRVYETGLFYMLFCCIENTNDSNSSESVVSPLDADQATLLKNIHMKQEFDMSVFNLDTEGVEQYETSFLRVLFPISVVKHLMQLSSTDFANMFNRDNLTPTIIWNKDMRLHLQSTVRRHLEPFVKKLGTSTEPIVYDHTPLPRIVYPQIENELYIKGYYLNGLLDPKWAGFKVDNPVELFNTIVDRFNATEMNTEINIEHLFVMMKTQLLLFDQCKSQLGISTYKGLYKCLDILAQFCNERNSKPYQKLSTKVAIPIELAESVVRFLFFSINASGIDDVTRANGHAILCTLLQTSHLKLLELQGTKGMEETREHMKDLNYFRLLLQGTCELIGKLFQYGEVTKNYVQNELHFDMCHLLLHHMCNCKIEDISVFKSVTRLLANSLCTVKPLAYKLWRSGILYILLHFICQRELPTPNHVIQYKYSLQVLLNLYYADNQMVIEDLSKLLPNPLVRRFVRSIPPVVNTRQSAAMTPLPSQPNATQQSQSIDQLRNELLRDAETPYLIWNETSRTILIDHVESHFQTLSSQYQHASDISVSISKLPYPVFDNELQIATIYVRLFNKFVQENVGTMNPASYANCIEEPRQFLTGLIHHMTQDSPVHNQHKPMVIEAIYNLLKYAEAIDVNTTLQRELIENCLSLPEGQTALFKSLKDFYTKRVETDPVTYEYLCNVIRLCLTNSPVFMQRTSSTKVFHLLVYAFVYVQHLLQLHEKHQHHQQDNKEYADRIAACLLRILGPSIVDIHICDSVLSSGIHLYLICILCGALPFEDVHKQSTLKILSALSQGSSKGNGGESVAMTTLYKLLPIPIVNFISKGKYDAILLYQQNQETPDIIWKESMRKELIQYLKSEMTQYEAKIQNHQSVDITRVISWAPPAHALQYEATSSELQVAGIYVRLFNELSGIGHNKSVTANSTYKLPDPLTFLSQLVTRCIQVNAQTLHDKQTTLFQLLAAIYNVMNWDRCQYAKHESLPLLVATLFDILENEQSIVDNLILVLHIMYRMCDPFRGNVLFVDKFSGDNRYLDRLFAQMLLLEDYMETFLYVMLAYVRSSPQSIQHLISCDRIRILLSIVLYSDKVQQLKNRAAMVLMAMTSDSHFGASILNSDLWRQHEERWNQSFGFIELPPIDAPLPIAVNSLRVANSSTVRRKAMNLSGEIPKNSTTSINIVRNDPSDRVTVPVVAPTRPPPPPATTTPTPEPPKVNIVTRPASTQASSSPLPPPPTTTTTTTATTTPTPATSNGKVLPPPPLPSTLQPEQKEERSSTPLPPPPLLPPSSSPAPSQSPTDEEPENNQVELEENNEMNVENNNEENGENEGNERNEEGNENGKNEEENGEDQEQIEPVELVEQDEGNDDSATPTPPPPPPPVNMPPPPPPMTSSPPPPPPTTMNMPPPSPPSSMVIPPSMPPTPSTSSGGGGADRGDLLAQIRAKKALKKVSDQEKKYADAPVLQTSGSSSPSTGNSSSQASNPLLAAIMAKQQAMNNK